MLFENTEGAVKNRILFQEDIQPMSMLSLKQDLTSENRGDRILDPVAIDTRLQLKKNLKKHDFRLISNSRRSSGSKLKN